ncbi:MAG: polyribonucleotide nucleotidyltransferase [Candidatus Yanofskybacteria bacterium CG10_big_fil_rev_8_21_14_0_10_46_23]|uniref:Polyribonucleotide nucleotidyltransferase n=1 Tax=Candidatus Yanofskybacteria bacterium CG10_big_fil_rev_8_21_14_0_10_46_23 TaxID=1975098 RepID=A0A2H0R443_9BACT|nr:MAG: polyribonucleotide nucleotidyltransferase [Candidatus Yanofskybacteria bacterium CG10_big_fil_rev_8_21_14_0_10_46_23]
MQIKTYQEELWGETLSVEIGRLANQANGSCRIQYGETVVLVTATMSESAKDTDYFPLNVAYQEKYYAAGKIKGSKWIKREGRPADDAVLTGRLIDRVLRPRFDQAIRNEIQVVATILSFDEKNDPDVLALFGASLALMISNIPFDGPVAGIRVGKIGDQYVFNPNYAQRSESLVDVFAAGDSELINMIEADAKIVSEEEMSSAIMAGFKEFQSLIEFQRRIAKDLNPAKINLEAKKPSEELAKIVSQMSAKKLEEILYLKDKEAFKAGLNQLNLEILEHLETRGEQFEPTGQIKNQIQALIDKELDNIFRRNILEKEKRPDGRKLDEVRELKADVNVLPKLHGTGLFERGTTQALTVLTLAGPGMEQWIETMELELTKKRFMHDYVFPPFSTGETGRIGFTGRREIGHGALAERALQSLIPAKEDFPYTIRLVSEILSSNGSSSMASVCGSSLALMDGGVPIKEHAAGIAIGLVSDNASGRYKILTDIQGPEDHHGDMDFKVAGTKRGISVIQMDVKIQGINEAILKDALTAAKEARQAILEKLSATIAVPRAELSPNAPRIKTIKINPEKIGLVIGGGGKTINKIIEESGAEIDIEDDGNVFITSNDEQGMAIALDWIDKLTREVKIGDIFKGRVEKVTDFGAFVNILPGQDGLVHVSEMSREHVKHPSDKVTEGDIVEVKVKNIDQYGKISLTMKGLGDQVSDPDGRSTKSKSKPEHK